jgi:hypothetical protein
MAEGHTLHIANPTAIQKYSGLKYSDNQHDEFWLAEMLQLGILPEGDIYPKEGGEEGMNLLVIVLFARPFHGIRPGLRLAFLEPDHLRGHREESKKT